MNVLNIGQRNRILNYTDLIYKLAQYFSIPKYSGTVRHLPNPTAQKLFEISVSTYWPKMKFHLVLVPFYPHLVRNIEILFFQSLFKKKQQLKNSFLYIENRKNSSVIITPTI